MGGHADHRYVGSRWERAPVSNSALGLSYGHGILTIMRINYYDDLHVYYI